MTGKPTGRLHTVDYYLDGNVTVTYCRVCSKEGDELRETDCKGFFPLIRDLGDKLASELDKHYDDARQVEKRATSYSGK